MEIQVNSERLPTDLLRETGRPTDKSADDFCR
jgi:hypothetical protein